MNVFVFLCTRAWLSHHWVLCCLVPSGCLGWKGRPALCVCDRSSISKRVILHCGIESDAAKNNLWTFSGNQLITPTQSQARPLWRDVAGTIQSAHSVVFPAAPLSPFGTFHHVHCIKKTQPWWRDVTIQRVRDESVTHQWILLGANIRD